MKSQNLPITGPCPIDLDAIGFDRASKQAHCGHCDKSVHNLSNMSRDEAASFLKQNAGKKLCVSYARRTDGTILFKGPPPSVVPLSRVRASARRAMPAAAALGLAAALAACTPHGSDEPGRANPAKVEQHQPNKVEPPKVEPDRVEIQLAGMMPIPEKIEPEPEIVDGEMPIPEKIEQVEGRMKIPDEPCDKTKETAG
jgi:hypothetical protein